MIKSLIIQSFQSHKFSSLEFDEGVNVIIGSSDSGKSSIIRALSWVINNRPTGDAFIRNESGSGISIVTIEPEENFFISRRKSKKENLYIVSDEDKDDLFEAFGQGVPEEISKVLNIDSINIQGQHDSVFLLAASPGEIARYFNKTVDLEQIDRAQQSIAKKLKEEMDAKNQAGAQVVEIESDLNELDWLGEAEPKIQNLKMLQSKIREGKSEKENLEKLIDGLKKNISNRKKHEKILKFEDEVDGLSELAAEISQQRGFQEIGRGIINELRESLSQAKYKNVIIGFEQGVEELLKLSNQIKEKEKRVGELNHLMLNIERMKKQRNEYKEEEKNLEKKFKKMIPNLCPFFDEPCPLKGKLRH